MFTRMNIIELLSFYLRRWKAVYELSTMTP